MNGKLRGRLVVAAGADRAAAGAGEKTPELLLGKTFVRAYGRNELVAPRTPKMPYFPGVGHSVLPYALKTIVVPAKMVNSEIFHA